MVVPLSVENELLARFVNTFQAAIRQEIGAIQRQSGNFEVVLTDAEQMAWHPRRRLGSYRFRVVQGREKLVDGASCTLRMDNVEHSVTIEAVGAGNVQVRVGAELSGKQGVLVISSCFLYERMLLALAQLKPETHQIQHALRLFGKLPVSLTNQPLGASYPELNGSQLAAVHRCKNSNLVFVWGPPGTGKTLTLACIISELVNDGKRILLTSNTNAALDQALARMVSLSTLKQPIAAGSVVRLGRTEGETFGAALDDVTERLQVSRVKVRDRIAGRLKDVVSSALALDTLLRRLGDVDRPQQQDLFAAKAATGLSTLELRSFMREGQARRLTIAGAKAQANWLRRRLGRLETLKRICHQRLARLGSASLEEQASVVARARVVLATLTGAYVSPLLQDQRFDVVIAEEASMAVLPNLFLAACLATDKVIAVGDPHQLPPIVQSGEPAVRRAMGRTIFDVTVPDADRCEFVVMLNTQYRMHPTIGTLVSELFYDGKLKHGTNSEMLERITQALPYSGDALVVLDTDGTTRCHSRAGSSSRHNPDTARLCVDIARRAVLGGAASVAVITPYVDQARGIRDLLRRDAQTRHIECSTVHRFQGHERDVIILDTVDAEPLRPGQLLAGTARDQTARHLLNVSISRARGKLIIVADVTYFRRNAPGSTITVALDHAQRSGKTICSESGSFA